MPAGWVVDASRSAVPTAHRSFQHYRMLSDQELNLAVRGPLSSVAARRLDATTSLLVGRSVRHSVA
jgi:hypothetical protein